MINVWGYTKEYESEKSEIMAAIESVFSSGTLVLGPEVKAFESEFATYSGQRFGIGVGNGTDAIFLALKALGVGDGDEVITVPNTAVPTVAAITATGAKPVFVDICEASLLMDVQQVKSKISNKTKVIIPVHLFGQMVDMDPLIEIAETYGLKILEDCAQGHGALYKGHIAGSLSSISTFSFYPTKILGTYGDGGMCLTSNPELEKKLRRLRFYGMEKQYYSLEQGYNSRLDELHAAILRKKLKHIEEYITKRRQIAARYYEELKNTSLGLPKEMDYGKHAYYIYVVRHKERDSIIKKLFDNEINVNISYPWPIHTMSGYRYLGYSEGDMPNAEAASKEIFSLPMYPSLTQEEQGLVIKVLKDIL